MTRRWILILQILCLTVTSPSLLAGSQIPDLHSTLLRTPGSQEDSNYRGDTFLKVSWPDEFKVDHRLQKNVDFWISIYSKYSTSEGVIHDAKYIDRIFEEVSLSGPRGQKAAKDAKNRWKNVLLSLHHRKNNLENLSEDEKKVIELYKDVNEPNKYLNAAHRRRLRFQLGQKDQFIRGFQQSGRYLTMMEDIFRKAGLPTELTRLPFVESSFNLKARSKVGASGVWQFMKSTARLFLRMNRVADERNDPIRATEAAAKLLKLNYISLGNWALAVTAYNHGRKGMMRAVRSIGTDDLEDLTEEYRSRSFGFASTNFFAELLAAIHVEKNAAQYFGPIARDEPRLFTEVIVPQSLRIGDLIRSLNLKTGQDLGTIKELNPGLTEEVLTGRHPIPKGYFFRIAKQPENSSSAPKASQTSGH